MSRLSFSKWVSVVGLAGMGVLLSSLSSCARSQQLEGITIFPSGFTYGSSVPTGVSQTPIPLTAYGTYIHPPETKVITDSVTWASDIPSVATVDSSGNLTAGPGCGTANISATFYKNGNKSGNVVVGFMDVTVDGPASVGCTPAGAPPILSVTVNETTATSGTVASNPAGISCSIGQTCSFQFTAGAAVTLTATPATNFNTWTSGCSQTSGNTCTVFLQGNTTVVATFN